MLLSQPAAIGVPGKRQFASCLVINGRGPYAVMPRAVHIQIRPDPLAK